MKGKILPIIQKLVNSNIFGARIEEKNLRKVLNDGEITKIAENKIAQYVVLGPLQCDYCQSLDIKVEDRSYYYLIKCTECGEVYKANKKSYYDISYKELAYHIAKDLNLNCIELEDRDFYILGELEWHEFRFLFLFLPVELDQSQLLTIFHEILQRNKHVLCVLKDSILSDALNLCSIISSGSMIYIVPLSQINQKDIVNWLKTSIRITKLEEDIIIKIKDKKLRKLIISINTNPKYALTLLMHLKIIKKVEKREFDWELLENMVSTVFRQFYSADISFGGGKNKGESLPDNVFIVRNSTGVPNILGLVDCKSSEKADFDKELTEKHLNYLRKAEKIDFLKNIKKVLIYITFDIKGDSVLRFYERLEDELKNEEYVVILPVETLVLILELYLNYIIKGELKLKDTDYTLEEMLIKLFNLEYLRQLKRKYNSNSDILAYERLFRLNSEDILKEVQEMLYDTSSIENILEIYRDKMI